MDSSSLELKTLIEGFKLSCRGYTRISPVQASSLALHYRKLLSSGQQAGACPVEFSTKNLNNVFSKSEPRLMV